MLEIKFVKLALSFAGLVVLAIAVLTPASVRLSRSRIAAVPAATASISAYLEAPALPDRVSPSVPKTTLLASKPFRGFCACSCSSVPNCNTSADCGGAACTHSISCCEKPGTKDGLLAQNLSCGSSSRWKID